MKLLRELLAEQGWHSSIYDIDYPGPQEQIGSETIEDEEELPSVKTYSVEHIAKKHDVPVNFIQKQLKMGIEVEKEHTKKEAKAREIALDHLLELPDYYTRLKKMEKNHKA